MSWLTLLAAGLLEIVWASVLPETKSFTRLVPTVIFVGSLVASMYLLSMATRSIPIGVGYAVWVGIGAAGTFMVSVWRGADTSAGQIAAMVVLLIGIVGVRLTSGS